MVHEPIRRSRLEARASGDYFSAHIPALREMSEAEIKERFPGMRSVGAFRDALLCEVDAIWGSMLYPEESSIGGRAYRYRLAPIAGGYLSLKHALWMADNPGKVDVGRIPEWMRIDFPAIPLMADGGSEWFVPCLKKIDAALVVELYRMNAGFNGESRIALKKGVPGKKHTYHRLKIYDAA